jgi:hypothetical protein
MDNEIIIELKKSIVKIADFARAISLDKDGVIAPTMSEEISRYCEEALEIINRTF